MHAGAIKEEFLFCKALSKTTKVQMVNNFFAKQDFNWKRNNGSLCTDGAPEMLGKTSGFASLVKKEVPHIIVTHCLLHPLALTSKTLLSTLKSNFVYFCKGRQLCQSSSFEPLNIQKALSRNGYAI